MDAIRKKMQSLRGETEGLYAIIAKFEETTKEANDRADQVTRNKMRTGGEKKVIRFV